MDAFIDSNSPLRIRYSKRNESARFDAYPFPGTRNGAGMKKIIYKHLVDGLTAVTGGFTLQELNTDLPFILNNGVAARDERGMHIRITSPETHITWIFGFRPYGGRMWTISTICTTRKEGQTRKLLAAYVQQKGKTPGTQCTKQRSPCNSGQPGGAEYTKS